MYKYLRDLMNVADLVGDVDDIYMGDWGKDSKTVRLEGNDSDGNRFRLTLEVEVKKDGT